MLVLLVGKRSANMCCREEHQESTEILLPLQILVCSREIFVLCHVALCLTCVMLVLLYGSENWILIEGLVAQHSSAHTIGITYDDVQVFGKKAGFSKAGDWQTMSWS